ncbi:MAG: MBL fold metallo-hydrolase [Holophagales bacterium]|jgi:L-ascorbate metabolism protein UlaG (beta-lactamase superfamily)|nr:MBL fold metallo-hydrolase [Holophagales bacterium]MBK9965469.1 MBL fold metallo-hydrolase [Holophagales bacterium]
MTFRATHFGTATVLFEAGSIRLLTDPVFDPPGRRFSVLGVAGYRRVSDPPAPPGPGALDAVLLSHDHHGDNLDVAGRAIAREAGVLLTTTAGARRLGGNAKGLAPWESFEVRGRNGRTIRVTATPAQHGPRWLVPIAGPVVGFVLEGEELDGAVWVSGDTVLFEGLREVARRFPIRTAFLHVGRATLAATGPLHYTLTAEEAAEVAAIFGGACCVPIHYEGWSHFREGKDDVTRAFQRRGLSSRLRWLPRGEAVDLAP